MPDHEVAIVGAGPVGLLLACLLAQRGIDVAVYERHDGEDDRSRAIGIHPPGAAALDEAGIGSRVRDEALSLEGGEVLSRGRVLASVAFEHRQQVQVLPQNRTGVLLRERLGELQEGALRRGQEVAAVHEEGESVRLSIGSREVTASFAIGADGVRSGVRKQLGIPWREHSGTGWYAMVDIPDAPPGRRAQLYCEPAGLVESFPLPDGGRRWVASDPQRVLGDMAAFVRTVQERTGIRLEAAVNDEPVGFLARQHRAARLTSGRIALVGDAAHETSPIGGQGMNLGWVAASHLARGIERCLSSGGTDLRDYEQRALRAASRAQRRSRFYMTMGRPAGAPELHARNTLIRLMGTAPLRRRTADMITMRNS